MNECQFRLYYRIDIIAWHIAGGAWISDLRKREIFLLPSYGAKCPSVAVTPTSSQCLGYPPNSQLSWLGPKT